MHIVKRIAFLAAALAAPASAVEIAPDWQETLTRGTSALYGAMVAVDQNDNIYVTGSLPSFVGGTIITARYDQAGNQIWQREFDSPGTREQASWVATDRLGNVIVTGYTVGGSSLDGTGYVTFSYDPDGVLRWSDIISVPRGVTVRAVVDPTGNTYVTGRAWVTNAQMNTTDDTMTVKYAPDGTRLWTRTAGFDPTSADVASSLVLTPGGNVIVTGGAVGWFLTIEYDPTGAVVWTATEKTSGPAGDVAVAPSGDVYVVGTTWTMATSNQFLVIGYDAAGNLISSRMYPGYGAKRVVVDSRDNVIVTGYATALPGRGAYVDWLSHKIDPAGAVLWTQRYDQHAYNDEFPFAMVLGPDDEVYVTGQGGPGPLSGSLSYLRTVTIRYDADGTEAWTASTFDSVRGLGVAHSANGSVVVVGESPYLVLHYLPQTCVIVSELVRAVSATRSGDDVVLAWTPAAGANSYNVWSVAAKENIDRARASSSPPAIGVAGCSPPASASGSACRDLGGVSRMPSMTLYQVRGACLGIAEGP